MHWQQPRKPSDPNLRSGMARKTLFAFCIWVFCVILAPASSLVVSSTESSATLTTLPPASPTGNSTDPCAFADRITLIDRVEADWQNYNMSLLVATCAGVCPLVYGSGNPDISGIGVSSPFPGCGQPR